jgi:phage FluMu protein Com
MPKTIPCPRCNGTGYMRLEDFLDIKDRDGVGPVRAFGCPKCEGLGEIADPEAEDAA